MKLKKVFMLSVLGVAACGVAAMNNTFMQTKASWDLSTARSNSNANLLADSTVVASNGLHVNQAADAFSFDSDTLGGDAKCDNRSIHILENSNLPADYAVVSGQKKSTKDLDFFYDIEFKYANITAATYNHIGLVVGKDDSDVYHTIQFECYSPQSSEHRGFLFEGTSSQDGTTPFYTDGSADPSGSYEVNAVVKMSVIKEGNDYAVYIQDNLIATRTIEGLTPAWGIYVFGTYTTYSKACFKILNNYTDIGKYEPIDLARASTSYVINDNFSIGGNLRGWSDCASASGKTAAFGTNDGKDIRAFDQVDLKNAAINNVLVDPSTLSTYYSADVTFTGKTDQYGALGLLVGKKVSEGSTKYVTIMIEPERGHSLFYHFDVNDAGTTTSEANLEGYLFDNGVKHTLESGDEYKIEILKVKNVYSIYFDGVAVIKDFTTDLDGGSDVGDNVIPMFGVASNFCECSFDNLTFKVLDKGFSIKSIIVDEEVEAARLSNGPTYQGNLAISQNIRGWSDCASASGDTAAFGANDGKDVRAFVNFDYTTLRVNGQKPDATALKVYYSANITYKGRSNDAGSIGLLLGVKPQDGNMATYVTMGLEANRGHSLFYSFDVNEAGSTTAERNTEGYLFNNGVHHALSDNDTFRLEIIKDANSYSLFFNGEAIYKNFTGDLDSASTYLDGVIPMIGIYSNWIEASYTDIQMKVLTEGAAIVDPELEAAREYNSANLLADSETFISDLLLKSPGFGGDKFEFDGETLTGAAWCDDYTMRTMINRDMYNTHVLIDGEKTSKAACDYYYCTTFTFNKITSATYTKAGIVVGVDKDGVYHSIVLECYKNGASDQRGFLFTGSSDTLEVNPIYTDTRIPACSYEAGASWTMEVIKKGNDYKVFINGKYYVTTTMADLVPQFGIHTFGTYSDLSNCNCKIISECEPYIPDDTTTLKSIKVDGENLPGFDPDVKYYAYFAEEEEWPSAEDFEVETTSALASAEVEEVEDGKFEITVLAESGDMDTYYINFLVPQSSDTSLKSVKILGQNVTLGDTMTFSAPAHVSSIAVADVEVVANDDKADVLVTVEGAVVNIKVTAEDGTVKTYKVNVTFNLSGDATLSSLKIKGNAVAGFDPNKTDYTVETSETITAADIDAVATDSYANVEVSGKDGSFKVTVTAENGTTKVYNITITKPQAKKSGCGSSIVAASAIVTLVAAAGLVLVSKKKKEDK